MIRIPLNQVSPELQALFDLEDPAYRRRLAVLEGKQAGDILASDIVNPRYGLVRGAGGGTTFISRAMDAGVLAHTIRAFKLIGNVVIGLYPNDARLALLPTDADVSSFNVEFLGRSPEIDLETFIHALPLDCKLCPITRELFPRCEW